MTKRGILGDSRGETDFTMQLNIITVLGIMRQRIMLIILAVTLCSGGAYLASSSQTPMYRATAVMFVGVSGGNSQLEYNSVLAVNRIASTYEEMVNTAPVRERAASALNINEIHSEWISVTHIEDTNLIQVNVEHKDSQLATDVSNTMISEFAAYAQGLESSRIDSGKLALESRRQNLQEDRTQLVSQLNQEGTTSTSSSSVEGEIEQIDQLIAEIDSQLLALDANITTNVPIISNVDPAVVPEDPYSPRVLAMTALGGVLGLLIGTGTAIVSQFLDKRIKTTGDLAATTGLSTIGEVPDLGKLQRGPNQVFSVATPNAPASEAVRELRNNLGLSGFGINERSVVIAITSPEKGVGKSTVVANLGVVFAEAGHSTLMIDCDLRRPSLYKMFGVSPADGLSRYLASGGHLSRSIVHNVAVPRLSLLTSGPVPPAPSNLFSSARIDEVLEWAKSEFEIIILDCPPLLGVSETLLISSKSDATLLLAGINSTTRESLEESVETLTRATVATVGAVATRVKQLKSGYYYSHGSE